MVIKEQLAKLGSKRRSGQKMSKVVFFVDHDTGNPNSTAKNNADNLRNNPNVSASTHAFIDDEGVYITIPCLNNVEKAWHVQYVKVADNNIYGVDANDGAIGLELCYFPGNKEKTQKSYENYIEFAAYLCYLHHVDPSMRSGHFELDPQRRSDPNNALQYIGKKYQNMKEDIDKKYKEVYTTALWKQAIQERLDRADDWIKYFEELIKKGGLGRYLPDAIMKLYKK